MHLFKGLCLLIVCTTWVVASPQVFFPEEEEASVPNAPVENVQEEQVLQTRLGILSSYLNLEPVPDTKAIGQKEEKSTLKENPYIPEGKSTGLETCLCVPVGKCARSPPPIPPPVQPPPPVIKPPVLPPPAPVQPPVTPPPPPPPVIKPPILPPSPPVPPPTPQPVPIPLPPPVNTDGAGLIDIRIVNRPVGVRCSAELEYCCAAPTSFPPPPPPATTIAPGCGIGKPIDTPGVVLDPTQAKFGEFPWMVVILGPNNNYVGGGVLVTPRHVVTAAHKIQNFGPGSGLKVRLGEWDAKQNAEPFKYVELGVKTAKINPFFNRVNLHNDIAVLTLEAPVNLELNPHVNTVCMPDLANNFAGRRCWVTGWGKDAFGPPGNFQYILKKVDVPVLNSNDCENRLRTTRLGSAFQLSRSSFVCAGGEPGKDSCSGDGGSPLVCEVNGRAELVGLVAWGIGCAEANIPGVYVNTRSYADWISAELI